MRLRTSGSVIREGRTMLIATLSVMLLLAPFGVPAQEGQKIPRIGYLSLGAALPPSIVVQRLRELGYSDQQNVAIDYRFGEGRHDIMDALARELAHLKVDVIMAVGDAAIAA